MNFIKKLWQGQIDEAIHSQFVRFGKGVFGNRAVINFKTNGNVKLTTTFELANDLVELAASLSSKIKVSGILMTRDDPKALGFTGKKKTGIYEVEIEKEMSSEEIKKLEQVAYFMLFDCSAPGLELKIKKKLPKPGKGDAKVNDKFCVLEADKKFEKQIRDDFLFDIPEGKKIKIAHEYEINDIIMPAGEKDFEEIRKKAKRKGMLKRKIEIDGKTKLVEKAFAA
ncbi:hypothetical protein HZA33_02505 [Candidatus Pacearchaeota archaeon]|nr:hypothetical protein [Candidatus Pacearchaeota archaeon]